MTDAALRHALAYARRGWPVFPCLPGQKIPATPHGYKDATIDEQQITAWFGRGQSWNNLPAPNQAARAPAPRSASSYWRWPPRQPHLRWLPLSSTESG